MEQRYRIQNDTHFIEFLHNNKGYSDAYIFRWINKEFKGRWIRKIIQAYPSKIETNCIYPITYR